MDTTITGPSPAMPRVVADPAQVRAILADPGYKVPDPGRGAPWGTVAWLRQNVVRLANGGDHARRRELTEDLLGGLDPVALRARTRDATNAVIDEAGGRPFDAMALVARPVPGRLLAAAVGAADPEQAAGQLAAVTAAYLPGMVDRGTADSSVARLAGLLPDGPDEEVAARIGLLIQAYEATAGLIGNAVAAGIRAAVPPPAADLVAQALRYDPPVPFTRRVTPSGETIALDLTAARDDPAGNLAFGSGLRVCPGAAHAVALAEGAAGPLTVRCRGTGAEISYPAPPALHGPVRLELVER
jgi:cytochrome P450